MKIHIILLGLVLCPPLVAADKKSLTKEESAKIIEAAIRKRINWRYARTLPTDRPIGKLTKAYLEEVKELNLFGRRLTDVKGLEKLTNLTYLSLNSNPDLTKAQIDQLQKALPKCKIFSNPTK